MKKNQKIFLFFGIILMLFLKAGFAFALELRYPTINLLGQNLSLNDTSTLPDYARYFFNIGIVSAALIAAAVVAYGGVYYLIDFARGKFADEGKEWIKSGIIGLLLVMCAYLIAFTINPGLVAFKLGNLPGISLINPLTGQPFFSNAQTISYQEIPMGTLTENLLTRTTDCYGFDPEGNPVDGNQIKTDDGNTINGPTYLNHDRADCLLQLTDGAQKKAFVIAELADEINKLMNTCSCANPDGTSKCDSPCNAGGGNNGCDDNPPVCTGACKGNDGFGAACAPFNAGESCCDADTKDKIEHGPINAGGGQNANIKCDNPEKEYKGLDEFRCPKKNNCNDGSCNLCDGGAIKGFVEKQVKLNQQPITIIDQDKWGQLNLAQQLMYFKQKMADVKQKIQEDINTLDKAKSTLGSCYLVAIPSVNLLKNFQSTDLKQKIILTDKFSDPSNSQNKNPVDASKYCAGFNYDNSSCLKKCNDECPDDSTAPDGGAIKLYQDCGTCDKNSQAGCLAQQEDCMIKNAYEQRPCPNSPANASYKTFEDCVGSCQDDCLASCAKEYLECSGEYTACKNQCDNNSKCVLDNADSCLINSQLFNNCSNQISDPGNTKYCIKAAYLCKNGSNEYAGYPDCLNQSLNPESSSCAKDSDCPKAEFCASNNFCIPKYSASYFYNNPNSQKCPAPYNPPKETSACYSATGGDTSCKQLCPETSKCPPASSCPNCPCNQLADPNDPSAPLTLNFSVPNTNDINNNREGPANNAGKEEESIIEQKISAHEIVGPQCNGYTYSDDPLTFYCENNWTKDPNAELPSIPLLGATFDAGKNQEIPVGQTVDDAETWAENLINTYNFYSQDIQKMLDDIKKISDKQEDQYCACNSKYDDNNPNPVKAGKPICVSNCEYVPPIPMGLDDNGNIIFSDPSCDFVPCKGDSCRQMMDYLSQVWNDSRQLTINYINIYTSMLGEPRSDIMKELTYSRNIMTSCSVTQNTSGNAKLLNCTRAKIEKIPSIIGGKALFRNNLTPGYCYGKELGELGYSSLPGGQLTDNWFCAETTIK